MKKFFWLVAGIAAGAVVAKQVRENPKAKALLDDAISLAKEFGNEAKQGFEERVAELAAEEQAAKPASDPASDSASK